MFSAVSSAFVIDIYSKLQPDPSDQTAALLRAILLTLNHSAIQNQTLAVPTIPQNPPSEIVTATSLLFASLLISLLAAFIAMLGKQWLNRYLRHSGGSMVERCGDRQIKCDGLQKWPFRLIIESLPLMLQAALLLLACGLCRYMASINASVAAVLIGLTLLGVLFYVGIVVAGTCSYACPFQTPASAPLRSLWAKVAPRLIPAALFVAHTLCILRDIVRDLISAGRSSLTNARNHVRSLWGRIQLGILRTGSLLPPPGLSTPLSFYPSSLPTIQESDPSHIQEVTRWLSPKDMAIIRTTSVNDARCVSWILMHITDPESLDAAIRLAGTIRWFEDGVDTDPPYDILISTFHACFDSSGKVYPGSRDRAYYSGQAIIWIYALAMCKSEETARMFPLLDASYKAPDFDHDLEHILMIKGERGVEDTFANLLIAGQSNTHSHFQWVSNILLHLSWATNTTLDVRMVERFLGVPRDASPPLDAVLNRLLMCCNLLHFPVEEEALKVKDKSCGVSCPYLPSYSFHYSLVIAWNWS